MGLFLGVYAQKAELDKQTIEVLGHAAAHRWYLEGDHVTLSCRYGSFTLQEVSGPVVASVDLYVEEKYRRAGWADKFELLKLIVCDLVDARMLVATVNNTNTAELGAIQKHGWTQLSDLGDVSLWGLKLGTADYLT